MVLSSFLKFVIFLSVFFMCKRFFLMKKTKKVCQLEIIDISLHRKNAMAR